MSLRMMRFMTARSSSVRAIHRSASSMAGSAWLVGSATLVDVATLGLCGSFDASRDVVALGHARRVAEDEVERGDPFAFDIEHDADD